MRPGAKDAAANRGAGQAGRAGRLTAGEPHGGVTTTVGLRLCSLSGTGPGLAGRRRARSAVTMRWSHVQPRAWLGSTELGERQINVFFPELFTLSAPAVKDTGPPRPHPASAFS